MAGEGVGWLKLNRLKKLMEDESYRDFMVTKLNRGLNRKISPDDRIDDVVSFLNLNFNKLYNKFVLILPIFFFSTVHIKTGVQGYAEVPSGDGARSGPHLRELWPRRHGLGLPDDGDRPHPLLEQRPARERL